MENNLRAVVNKIEQAVRSVDYNMGSFFYGDIYNINHLQEVKYPAVIVTNSTHTSKSDYITYNFNIFYVDRLTADKSNKLDVQSMATISLNNALQVLDEGYIVNDNWEIHTFEEKFNDVCAGAYINVGIQCPIELCNVELPSYDLTSVTAEYDSNGDYTILPPSGYYGLSKVDVKVDVPEIPLVSADETFTENGEYIIEAPEGSGLYEAKITVDVEGIDIKDVKSMIQENAEIIVIPEGIEEIRPYGFYQYNYNSKVAADRIIIPNTVKRLGYQAFAYSRIKNIEIPSSITTADSYVFYNNSTVEYVKLSINNSYGLNWYMFSGCSKLRKVVIDIPTLREVGNVAFSGCSSLEEIDFTALKQVPTLPYGVSTFNNVPLTCVFKVPAALYNEWIAKTNWTAVVAKGYRFVAVNK